MTTPAALPSRVFECCQCEQTYFAGQKSGDGPHLCHLCGQPLTLRPEGAEPYSGGADGASRGPSSANGVEFMKFGSLFSGVGGFDLGFERAGMSCAWQCEIDE